MQATSDGGHVFTDHGLIGPLIDPAKITGGDLLWPLSITCNSNVADSVTGAHEYDWFVSQRRESGWYIPAGESALVYWNLPMLAASYPDATKSGTIALSPTSDALDDLLPGLAGDDLISADSLRAICWNVQVVVIRRADRAYQWANLYLSAAP
jgi:hypothetical protein